MEKIYVVIWKDREGNIHRTNHKSLCFAYLLFSYSWANAEWTDSRGTNHFTQYKKLLYIFKQK